MRWHQPWSSTCDRTFNLPCQSAPNFTRTDFSRGNAFFGEPLLDHGTKCGGVEIKSVIDNISLSVSLFLRSLVCGTERVWEGEEEVGR